MNFTLKIKHDFKIRHKVFPLNLKSVSCFSLCELSLKLLIFFLCPLCPHWSLYLKAISVPCMALILKFQLGKLYLFRFHNADLVVTRSTLCSLLGKDCGREDSKICSLLKKHPIFEVVRWTNQKPGTTLSPSWVLFICDTPLYTPCWCIRNIMQSIIQIIHLEEVDWGDSDHKNFHSSWQCSLRYAMTVAKACTVFWALMS